MGMQIPNLYPQIQNIDMQLQYLGSKINMMPIMNMNMNMNMQIPNMGFQNQNMMMNNNLLDNANLMMNKKNNELNLIFKEGGTQTIITITPEKTFGEAINLYKIKSKNNSENLMFINSGKRLNPKITISEFGLKDGSIILVY